MNTAFWHERWQQNQIGFHQDQINPYLERFLPALRLARGEPVFVPLCGKTQDMRWLHQQGHPVVGVELSPIAIEAFFQENGLRPKTRQHGAFREWEDAGIRLLCGDFFDTTAADLGSVRAVYDRAALIALPPDMRPRYAQHLAALLRPEARMLLVTLEYPQGQMGGPPFAVAEAEVRTLYGDRFTIEVVAVRDVLAENERFREKGLTRLEEKSFVLRAHPRP